MIVDTAVEHGAIIFFWCGMHGLTSHNNYLQKVKSNYTKKLEFSTRVTLLIVLL